MDIGFLFLIHIDNLSIDGYIYIYYDNLDNYYSHIFCYFLFACYVIFLCFVSIFLISIF